ncbi:MAG: hypothetical protein ACQEXE_01595 [Bacillota bacterium]|jgi:hypothetical protein|uniref:hypothetical protein n=1 Tax=Cytobacillus firmus TaxID=1399 RepID=UPI0024C16870|nr:hypothetical protein [Cytobacillus firmus]WHY35619.1 hypothetical protein QNH44_07720 [Cytobacillus firmus]
MAKSFLVCDARNFFEDDFFVPIQQTLLEDEGASEVSLKLNHANFHLGFDQYLCQHDYIHNKSGRVFNKHFNYYFEPLKFYTYHHKELNLAFIQTKAEAAVDFMNKINSTKHYNLSQVQMDFKNMIPLVTEVAGAWIADLKRAHLKTAGFFGPNVHKSEEYIEAAAEGNVSSIQMKFISERSCEEYTITISKKGSVVLYDTLPTVEDEIGLVFEVYNRLIKPHL